MGGTLAVTIREPSGKVHVMNRWTNPTPYFVNNPMLCDKDPKFLAAYLEAMDAGCIRLEHDDVSPPSKDIIGGLGWSLREFARRGKVLGYVPYIKTGPRSSKQVKMTGWKFDRIISFLEKGGKFGGVYLDMSPFKVTRFEESNEGGLKMLARLRKLGFEVSKKDEAKWKEWHKE